MKVFLEKGNLKGTINAIGSKSFAHRFLISSFLSKNTSKISNIPSSKDIEATLNCLKALGANYEIKDDVISFLERRESIVNPVLDCIESGSTLRFLIPVALALTNKVTFVGTPRLIERGIGVYEKIMNNQGITITKNSDSLSFEGTLKSGIFEIDGSISSQFVTGLLFALPLLDGDSLIKLIPPINSKNYIDITLSILSQYGIKFEVVGNDIKVKGNQAYVAKDNEVEGDYSNSAFLDAFNYFGSNIKVNKLNPNSLQGDMAYINLFSKLYERYCEIDISNCIDLGPVLFVFAAMNNGGRFIGTSRLAIKESNRAESIKEELMKIGASIKIESDSVAIEKTELNYKNEVTFNSHNDHRIAMALSLLSAKMNIAIDDYEAINKSYPEYFKVLEKLGGKIRYE